MMLLSNISVDLYLFALLSRPEHFLHIGDLHPLKLVDRLGLGLSTSDEAAVGHFDAAVSNMLTFQGNPVADLDRAIATDPGFLMASMLKALILGLSTEKSQVSDATALLAAAQRIWTRASSRETKHVAAVDAWLDGRFSDACAVWEDILVEHPNDAIAMFAAHQADFFLGQLSELCHRVARRLPDIEQGSVLQGYYWGMYAFGLEEMGDYTKALDVGRRAVGRDRNDAWAIHAVAHVFEMTNRVDEGEQWLLSHANDWVDSNLAVHIWWHLALYYCDQQRWDRVLELYDAGIRRAASNVVMEQLDASALLWRLKLYDVDVGNRWQSLAETWEPRIGEAWYAFNDMHAMMAFCGAGRFDLAQRLIAVQRATAVGHTENGMVTRTAGLPVSEALLAYAESRYAPAVGLLAPVRNQAVRAGGSHAQRDVLAQTLLSAAEKAGQIRLARALLNERLALRPHSILNQSWMERVMGL
jgi:tetratricopeptide (TPR) repeat protein